MSKSISSTNDQQLIQQVLAGRVESFGLLVQRYQDRLFNGMVPILRSEPEAEDIVQEAFVLAFTKLDSFQGNSAFFTWLYRIAYNLAISRLRRRRGGVSLDSQREKTGFDLPDVSASPSSNLEQQERIELVHEALGKLSEEHRSILVLREMQELDYEAISEILDLPIGTVRSRLHRAREQLREQLNLIDH